MVLANGLCRVNAHTRLITEPQVINAGGAKNAAVKAKNAFLEYDDQNWVII
jgi:hypothetical protein